MKTTQRITADSVSSSEPRVLKEIEDVLDRVNEDLEALSKQLEVHQRETAAGFSFKISQKEFMDSPEPMSPDQIKSKIGAKDMETLAKNYDVVNHLYDALETTQSAAAKLKSVFPEDSPQAQRLLKELAATERSIKNKITDAFDFLQELAKTHAPKAFLDFLDKCYPMVQKGISYAESQSFMYMFMTEGTLAFANYLHLMRAVDESGEHFPDLFVIFSMKFDNTPTFYVTTQTESSPPSNLLFVKQVSNARDVARALPALLQMDSFDNSIGSLPIPLLMDPGKLKPDLFSAAQHIDRVDFFDDSGLIDFRLKPTVQSDETVNLCIKQINDDLKKMVQAFRGTLRAKKRVLGDRIHLLFYISKDPAAPRANEEDLQPLAQRFGLGAQQVKRIMQIVNASTYEVGSAASERALEDAVKAAYATLTARGITGSPNEIAGHVIRHIQQNVSGSSRYINSVPNAVSFATGVIRSVQRGVALPTKQKGNVYENVLNYIDAMKKASRTKGWTLDQRKTSSIRWVCAPKEPNSSTLMASQYVLTFFTQQFGRPVEKTVGDLRTFTWTLQDEVPVVVTLACVRGGSFFEVTFKL